jgi:hypothetical protein
MTKLRQHIEDVRLRLTAIAEGELALVEALGDALSRVDERLLRDVRNLAAEHEARRGAILGELQTLAARMGAFPASHEPLPAIAAEHEAASHERHGSALCGDWRQATKNMENDLDFLDAGGACNGHSSLSELGFDRDIRKRA